MQDKNLNIKKYTYGLISDTLVGLIFHFPLSIIFNFVLLKGSILKNGGSFTFVFIVTSILSAYFTFATVYLLFIAPLSDHVLLLFKDKMRTTRFGKKYKEIYFKDIISIKRPSRILISSKTKKGQIFIFEDKNGNTIKFSNGVRFFDWKRRREVLRRKKTWLTDEDRDSFFAIHEIMDSIESKIDESLCKIEYTKK